MDNDKLLDLAREDSEGQERYSSTLQKSAQFALTLGIGIATASIAMFKVELINDMRISAIFFWAFATLLWVDLAWVGTLLGRTLWSQKMTDPRSIEDYLKWRNKRREELEAWEVKQTAWEKEKGETALRKSPEERANEQIVEQMLSAYAESACHNRVINLRRQRFISAATVRVIIAAGLLGGQAVSDCWFVYDTAHHGETKSVRSAAGTVPTTTHSS